jgi:hypothetical protein
MIGLCSCFPCACKGLGFVPPTVVVDDEVDAVEFGGRDDEGTDREVGRVEGRVVEEVFLNSGGGICCQFSATKGG